MKITELKDFFINYARIIDCLIKEASYFNGAYKEISLIKRKEVYDESRLNLFFECVKENINFSDLELILKKELPERLFNNYVKNLITQE